MLGWLFTIRGLVALQYLAVALCTLFFLPVDYTTVLFETTKYIAVIDPVLIFSAFILRAVMGGTSDIFAFLRYCW